MAAGGSHQVSLPQPWQLALSGTRLMSVVDPCRAVHPGIWLFLIEKHHAIWSRRRIKTVLVTGSGYDRDVEWLVGIRRGGGSR